MRSKKIILISLGCEKNLVDSEMILGFFNKNDFKIVSDINKSDVIVVNTCGFIESAKKEAIDTILNVIEYKKRGKKIVVTGCLVERYLEDLKKEIPEVDLWIPIRDYFLFGEKLKSLFNKVDECGLKMSDRIISTNKPLAYLRISDGCNNRCNYCAIPLIRGDFKSREKADIINEFKGLLLKGMKEICLISQDLTKYGVDIKSSLAELLNELLKIEGDYKLRLLYLYPDEIKDELIEVCKNEKIMPYFDIPIQHATNKMLKLMNRRGSKEFITDLIKKIRKNIPDAVIRTTILVGFPNEKEEDIDELCKFLEEVKFDHLGVFTYSKEEDTKGYYMDNQVDLDIMEKRKDKVLGTQKWISLKNNEKYLNKIINVLVEEYDKGNDCYYGRGYMHAPDDIDGLVIIYTDKTLEVGNYYDTLITDVDFYDLIGKI